MPVVLRAAYSCVTPLFCGGADPKRSELRLSSFKGVLRYWWRALAWSKFHGDLRRIETEEANLFGGAGSAGQSKVAMRLVVEEPGRLLRPGDRLAESADTRRDLRGVYYLGYGLVQGYGRNMGCVTRAALVPPIRFVVEMLVSRDKVGASTFQLLIDALKAVGLVGGMGARSRRGFGSLVLTQLTVQDLSGISCEVVWKAPQSVTELREAISGLHTNRASPEMPVYTAFSAGSRAVIVRNDSKNALSLLNHLGEEMMYYRSWGRNGLVLGEPSERRFREDHDLMLLSDRPTTHPRRVAFGLPHNYFFSSSKDSRTRSVRPIGPRGKELDRRASPLFIHIHMCGDDPVAVLTFLPAQFLPPGSAILVNGVSVPIEEDEKRLYEPVEEFLNRLLGRSSWPDNKSKVRWTQTEEVRWAWA